MTVYIETMSQPASFEHPEDVLGQWRRWTEAGGAARAIGTGGDGGGVRAPGALMAVPRAGDRAGYLSGGCIDADVAAHAVAAIETGTPKHLRYGAGSAFKDLPLPCGGAIEVAILPRADAAQIQRCQSELATRRPASLRLKGAAGAIGARYRPKLRLRIAGRGADAIALAQLSRAAGFPTELWLRADDAIAQPPGLAEATVLQSPAALPEARDDVWTAFVLMFHDGDWEGPLLRQALAGPAFYIGAVGSHRTHARRRQTLADQGVRQRQIERVRGPIGLVPSMRDASMLAVSALAEIVDAYHRAAAAPFATTALTLLAAGRSSRFEDGDKLLADLAGGAVIDHSASALSADPVATRIAVVGPADRERRTRVERAGWRCAENPEPELGQGASLATAIRALKDAPGVEAAFVLLGDMPHVPDAHLRAMRAAMTPGVDAVMSRANGVLGPPALFAREVFPKLEQLTGDRGARKLFDALSQTRIVDLAPEHARDIDRRADLLALEAPAHG